MSSLQISSLLSQIGLSREESAVYLCLLDSGILSMAELSKCSSTKRSTLYLYVDRLLALGVIKKVIKGKRTLFTVASPASFKKIISQEKQLIDTKENLVNKIIPMLVKQYSGDKYMFTCEVLEGQKGFSFLIDKVIEIGQDIYWIGPFEKMLAILGDKDFFRMMTWRRMDQSTTAHAVTDSTILKHEKYSDNIGKFRKIIIEDGLIDTNAVFACSGDYFAAVDFSGNINTVIIKDVSFAGLFRSMFSLIKTKDHKAFKLDRPTLKKS